MAEGVLYALVNVFCLMGSLVKISMSEGSMICLRRLDDLS